MVETGEKFVLDSLRTWILLFGVAVPDVFHLICIEKVKITDVSFFCFVSGINLIRFLLHITAALKLALSRTEHGTEIISTIVIHRVPGAVQP